jgi:ELWxxDGT repeat protein
VLVKDINPGDQPSEIFGLALLDGTTYFAATDGTNGFELWKSDGTEGVTQMVKDINPSGDGCCSQIAVVGDTLYFGADDGTHGNEVWKSDGTSDGTEMVEDIDPAGSGSPTLLTGAGGTPFFAASGGATGRELWASDGTEDGRRWSRTSTRLVTACPPS